MYLSRALTRTLTYIYPIFRPLKMDFFFSLRFNFPSKISDFRGFQS